MTRDQLAEMRRRIAMAQRHLATQVPNSPAWTAMLSWIEELEAQILAARAPLDDRTFGLAAIEQPRRFLLEAS